jgi:hypothetical protein
MQRNAKHGSEGSSSNHFNETADWSASFISDSGRHSLSAKPNVPSTSLSQKGNV